MLEKTEKREALFWAKVKKSTPDQCWEWTASKSKFGYGRIGTTKNGVTETYYAHRVCYEWYNGPTDGVVVRHKCDNPKCVNPNHLEAGSHLDNCLDMVKRGRHVGSRKITQICVAEIRAKRKAGASADDLASEYGLHAQHIRAICRGRYWGGGDNLFKRRFLTEEELLDIKKGLADGRTRKELQDMYGFSKALIAQIALGLKDHLLKGDQ